MRGLGANTIKPSSNNKEFSRVSKSNASVYSTFDTKGSWHGSIDNGYLIPFCGIEVIPGEYGRFQSRHLVRMSSPAVVPFMQNLYLNYELFYVKNRMIYDNWKKLMGEQRNPTDSTDFLFPVVNSGSTGFKIGSLFDFFGAPPNIPNYDMNSGLLRCYNLIFNEWYRDQNYQNWHNVGGTGTAENPVDEFGDSDQLSNYKVLKRNKSHDYFTSILPWQQKGDPVYLNLSEENLPIRGNGNAIGLSVNNGNVYYMGSDSSNSEELGAKNLTSSPSIGTKGYGSSVLPDDTYVGLSTDTSTSGIVGDLSQVLGISISDFRIGMQLQALKELDARGGTRYNEKIYNEFGVTIADAELHRPELLCAKRIPFYTTPMAQTSTTTSTAGETPQGNLVAVSHAYADFGIDFVKGFDDYGYVVGLLSITTDNYYQQGLHKKWSRRGRYDYYHPLLANISEQPVTRKELIIQGNDVTNEDGTIKDDDVIGFQEAYAPYKYGENIITSLMRSNRTNPSESLDRWHLAPYYDPATTEINGDFLEQKIPIRRVLSITGVTDEDMYPDVSDGFPDGHIPEFLVDSWWNFKKTSPMPVYNVPAYLGSRF